MATLADGTYVIRLAADTSKAMDVVGASDYSGADVQVFTINYSSAQIVHVITRSDGSRQILFSLTGKCLDIDAANIADGSNVQQWDDNDSAAQRWAIIDSGSTVTIDSKAYTAWSIAHFRNQSYVCDCACGGTSVGTNIQLWSANSTAAQRFVFWPVDVLPEGYYELRSALDTDVCVDVSCASKADGANVQMYSWDDTNAQKFYMGFGREDGCTGIMALHSRKYLDVSGGGTINGTNVQQFTGNNTNAQQWLPEINGYTKINGVTVPLLKVTCQVGMGNCLDAACGSTALQTRVQVWESNGTKAQRWAALPTEAYGSSMPVPSSYMMRFPDGRDQTSPWGNCPLTNGVTDGVQNSDGTWTTKFYPSFSCATNLLQVRYRLISYKAGNHSSYTTSAWMSLRDSSTSNQGWGDVGSCITMTRSGSRVVSPYGIDVTVGSGSGQCDQVVVEVQARSYATSYGDEAIAAHGPTYGGKCTCVWSARPTFSAAAMSYDGIWMPYTSTLSASTSAATLSVSAKDADGNVVFNSCTNTNMSAADTFKVPTSALAKLPEDGSTLTLSYTMTTQYGVARSGSAQVTISSDTDHGIAVAPTFVYDSYLRGYRCTFKAGTTNACYVYVTSGHKQAYEACEQISEDSSAGTVTFLVLPQFGKATTVLTSAYISNTKWGFNSDTLDAISSEDAVWNWSIGSNIVSAALRVSIDSSPSHTYDLTPDYSVHVTTGREHEVVTFGESMTGEFSSTGVIVPDLLSDIPGQIETNFDALAYTGPRGEDVIFRDAFGRWARVAIIGVSQPHQLSIYSALTVKMREVTP
jgi:hypothetical protein